MAIEKTGPTGIRTGIEAVKIGQLFILSLAGKTVIARKAMFYAILQHAAVCATQTRPIFDGNHADFYSASTNRLYPPRVRTVTSSETAKQICLGSLAIFWTSRSPSSMQRGV